MIGYKLENTLTESGYVARGICDVSDDGFLGGIVERTRVIERNGKIAFTEDEGETWGELCGGTPVSMNFWGFPEGIMTELAEMFPKHLDAILKENPLKGEFYLPLAVAELIRENKAGVKVIMSKDKWHGVTYAEDKEPVAAAMRSMVEGGMYREKLWG